MLRHIPKDYAVFLFGSRARDKKIRFSDIDIGVLGAIEFPVKVRRRIEEDLESSIVPYRVDIVDFLKVEDYFREEAMQNIEIWQNGKATLPN